MAELLKNELGGETELIVGDRSEFSVWVNDKVVLKRENTSSFPEDQKMLEAVRETLKSQGE
ncbi:MAG TPA: Rdx family protein [Pyrinomonadaceae bacterium]|nr:Rdx family protein [Pyrinomonadaceae bacterium]